MSNETTAPLSLRGWIATIFRRVAERLAPAAAERPTIDAIRNELAYDAGVVRLPRAKQRGKVIFDNVTVSPRLRALLERLPRVDGCPYLFTNRDGNPYNSTTFKGAWSRCW